MIFTRVVWPIFAYKTGQIFLGSRNTNQTKPARVYERVTGLHIDMLETHSQGWRVEQNE